MDLETIGGILIVVAIIGFMIYRSKKSSSGTGTTTPGTNTGGSFRDSPGETKER